MATGITRQAREEARTMTMTMTRMAYEVIALHDSRPAGWLGTYLTRREAEAAHPRQTVRVTRTTVSAAVAARMGRGESWRQAHRAEHPDLACYERAGLV